MFFRKFRFLVVFAGERDPVGFSAITCEMDSIRLTRAHSSDCPVLPVEFQNRSRLDIWLVDYETKTARRISVKSWRRTSWEPCCLDAAEDGVALDSIVLCDVVYDAHRTDLNKDDAPKYLWPESP